MAVTVVTSGSRQIKIAATNICQVATKCEVEGDRCLSVGLLNSLLVCLLTFSQNEFLNYTPCLKPLAHSLYL